MKNVKAGNSKTKLFHICTQKYINGHFCFAQIWVSMKYIVVVTWKAIFGMWMMPCKCFVYLICFIFCLSFLFHVFLCFCWSSIVSPVTVSSSSPRWSHRTQQSQTPGHSYLNLSWFKQGSMVRGQECKRTNTKCLTTCSGKKKKKKSCCP